MNNKIYIGVIVVMLGVIGYLAYKMNTLEGEKVYIYKEYEKLDTERQELAMELEELNLSYDTLSTDNEAMKLEIAGQKEEIEKLLVKVKNGNYEVRS
jgi:chromosome segregation ATPase